MTRLVIFFLTVILSSPPQASDLKTGYSATYILSTKNIKIGTVERTLIINDNGTYSFTSKIIPIGLGRLLPSIEREQLSYGEKIKGHFIPSTYFHKRKNKNRSYQLQLNLLKEKTDNTEGNPSLTPVLDELVYQAQMQVDLFNKEKKYEYLVQKKHKKKIYAFKVSKSEMVKTSFGNFLCQKMQRLTKNRHKTLTLWVSAQLDYVPVKIELLSKGERTIALLEKLSPLD